MNTTEELDSSTQEKEKFGGESSPTSPKDAANAEDPAAGWVGGVEDVDEDLGGPIVCLVSDVDDVDDARYGA